MQSDSSAKRTCSECTSAVECTATDLMPSSRAARMIRSAISPRLAMRILENITYAPACGLRPAPAKPAPPTARASCGLEAEERLAVLDGAAILDERVDEAARPLRLDLVHQLHRLDDAEDLALLHHRAHLDEGRVVRGRRPIEGT